MKRVESRTHTVKEQRYLPDRTSQLILYGTLITALLLSLLLVAYDVVVHSLWFRGNVWVSLAVIAYLCVARYILMHISSIVANWMLVLFYEVLAFCTLVTWGINAPVGILALSFAVILPNILIGPKSIFPVASVTVFTVILVQLLHEQKMVTPNLTALSQPSSMWDVTAYSIILAIFALVSWIGGTQREKALNRALLAERELQKQKKALSIELERESAALRHAQLKQMRELHKFAFLGQSAAATLHELSSHLSILNLDIDDLRQHDANSEAIINAKDSIHHINKMVRQARQQLNSYDQHETFDAVDVINQSLKDMREKFTHGRVEVTKALRTKSCPLTGSPVALMHILTILLNNAVDACCDMPSARITVSLKGSSGHIVISVIDNGTGIDPSLQPALFSPIVSKKSSGMGVGLYIAHHLTNNQFSGNINLKPSKRGAHFVVTIPKSCSMIPTAF